MFAQVKVLWWWKQVENTRETCEDAYNYSVNKGLFAVADGMSTKFFSRIWANILVDYFVHAVPLFGNDPFETEWWLRPGQLEYINKSPKVETLQPSSQSKAREGSAATLATVRVSAIHDETSARAELLAFGDSCIFVGNRREQKVRVSFPQGQPSDFDRAPVGLPSLPWKYDRHFHRAVLQQITLHPDDVLILATDAVAKWIISNGANTCSTRWEAFQRIINLESDNPAEAKPGREGTWSQFIQQCRNSGQMVNDDVTALIVSLSEHGEEKDRLGATSSHPPSLIQSRKKEFQEAVAKDQKDLIAITYGDGKDLPDVSYPAIEKARQVADALSRVWHVFRREINSPDLATKVRHVLQTYGPVLVNEPCAEDLKNTLDQFGILLESFQQEPQEREKVTPTPTENGQTSQPILDAASFPSALQQATEVEEKTQPTRPSTSSQFIKPSPPLSGDEGDVLASRRLEGREHEQEEDERKKIELIRNFYKALYKGDTNTLFKVEKDIRKSPYSELLSYVEMEQERMQGIYERKRTWERVHEVMHSRKSAKEKLEAYDAAFNAGHRSFPSEVEQQADLASKFISAYELGDDDAILGVFLEIKRDGFERLFAFSEEEKDCIERVQESRAALNWFRHLVSGQETAGLVTAKMVFDAHKNLLNHGRELEQKLSSDEHYQVDLASRYLRAYFSTVDEDLVDVYNMIYYSPFKFTYSDEERSRINAAQQRYRLPSPSIAIVNDHQITLHQYEGVYSVTKAFLEDIIWQLHVLAAGERPPLLSVQRPKRSLQIIPAVESRIVLLRKDFNHQAMLVSMVEDLILQKSAFTSQKTIDTKSREAADQIYKVRDDMQRIDSHFETLKVVMAIFIRYAFVAKDLQDQHENIEQWLLEQKQTMHIAYPERAIIVEPSSNTDPAQSWLLSWPQLESDIKGNYRYLFG